MVVNRCVNSSTESVNSVGLNVLIGSVRNGVLVNDKGTGEGAELVIPSTVHMTFEKQV